jgi:hypothetical protein
MKAHGEMEEQIHVFLTLALVAGELHSQSVFCLTGGLSENKITDASPSIYFHEFHKNKNRHCGLSPQENYTD